MKEFISIWHRAEKPLFELLQEAGGLDERAKIVMLERAIKLFDGRLRGLSRRSMPDATSWIAAAQALTELAERAPRQVVPALRSAFDYCVAQAEALIQKRPSRLTLKQRCQRLEDCRKEGIVPDATFAIALKSVDGSTRRLAGRASSTQEDRDSDVFSIEALRAMRSDIRGVPVFLDHKYAIHNVVGKVVQSALTERGQYTDLDVVIELLPEGDAGSDKVWSLVEAAVPIGLSVGVLVYQATPRSDNRRGDMFNSVEVVDLSIVGIPSQRRSTGLTPVKDRQAKPDSKAAALIGLKRWKESQANK